MVEFECYCLWGLDGVNISAERIRSVYNNCDLSILEDHRCISRLTQRRGFGRQLPICGSAGRTGLWCAGRRGFNPTARSTAPDRQIPCSHLLIALGKSIDPGRRSAISIAELLSLKRPEHFLPTNLQPSPELPQRFASCWAAYSREPRAYVRSTGFGAAAARLAFTRSASCDSTRRGPEPSSRD
jgi:hypothetical protein